VTASNRNEYQE